MKFVAGKCVVVASISVAASIVEVANCDAVFDDPCYEMGIKFCKKMR